MHYRALTGAGLALAMTALVIAACSDFSGDPAAPVDDGGPGECTTCVDAGGGDTTQPTKDGGAEAGDTVVDVKVGGQFACALRSSKTVSCWGRNNEGQIGQPPEGDLACDDFARCRPTPIAVPGLSDVVQLALGQLFGCARTADGSVLCWGSNEFGVLGSGSASAPRFTPGVVPGLPHAIDVSAGAFNACARVDQDGGVEVYCWGTNREGMLGTVASSSLSGPTRIPALAGAKAIALSRASEVGCAILADDTVSCWGQNYAGVLGHATNSGGDLASCNGTNVCNHVPSNVGGTDFKASDLAIGFFFGCARLLGTHDVSCWGYDTVGSIGNGTTDFADHPQPAVVAGLTGTTSLVAGGLHACALGPTGLRCWGNNGLGELGNANASDGCSFGPCKSTPQAVVGLSGGLVRIAAGFSSTFATTSDGEWAWGANPDGRLGHAAGASGDLAKCTTNTGRCNPNPQRFAVP